MTSSIDEYVLRLNFFRYNLVNADKSVDMHPLLVEKVMSKGIQDVLKEMEEKNIHIPGYN